MIEQTWQMLIPAITGLGGIVIGLVGTYFATKSNNKHQSKMQEDKFAVAEKIRSEEWERSEERLYERKVEVYLKYINYSGFEFRNDNHCEKLYALVVEIVVFAPLHIREHVMKIFNILIEFEKTSTLYVMIITDDRYISG